MWRLACRTCTTRVRGRAWRALLCAPRAPAPPAEQRPAAATPPPPHPGVVHADLKSANVLLKAVGHGRIQCKLADFGLSRMLPPSAQSVHRTTMAGTVQASPGAAARTGSPPGLTSLAPPPLVSVQYMPPEVLERGRLSTAADVYSFGILSEPARVPCWGGNCQAA